MVDKCFIRSRFYESLSPKEFGDVPTDNLKSIVSEILSNAELIANSIPPPPNGTPYESPKRIQIYLQLVSNAVDLTISEARGPLPVKAHEALQKS
jgi:hypothetical protein